MKILILVISAASGFFATPSSGMAAGRERFSNRSRVVSATHKARRARTRHLGVARHQQHSVKYYLDKNQKRRFDSHSLAHRWANYVRSLGADATLSEIAGRYYVRYQMRGSRIRRFHNDSLARSFERRLEANGFHARVTRF